MIYYLMCEKKYAYVNDNNKTGQKDMLLKK